MKLKLKGQGEIELVPRETFLEIISKPVEKNKYGDKKPFSGSAIIQPFQVKNLWHTLEGKTDKFVVRSGKLFVVFRNYPQKGGHRIIYMGEESQSSYFLTGYNLAKFKDAYLEAVRKLGAITISQDGFSAARVADKLILRDGKYEFFLEEKDKAILKDIIYKNYLIKEPSPIKTPLYVINNNKDLIYKKVSIPLSAIKDLYLFILS